MLIVQSNSLEILHKYTYYNSTLDSYPKEAESTVKKYYCVQYQPFLNYHFPAETKKHIW